MQIDIFKTDKKYNVIYADPPWRNKKSGSKPRNNEKHYPSMAIEEICELPIERISAEKSILFIWVCFPCLEDSFKVIQSWGFEYYGLGFDWCKIKKDGTAKIGCGYYTRQNNEVCLIGVKKRMNNRIKPLAKNICCSILEKPREHSRKPDIVRDYILKICGDVPRIELFAREEKDGWDSWGNEVGVLNE